MPRYPDDEKVRDARGRYFDANRLGEGGYTERWVKFQVGPVPVGFPNTAGRAFVGWTTLAVLLGVGPTALIVGALWSALAAG